MNENDELMERNEELVSQVEQLRKEIDSLTSVWPFSRIKELQRENERLRKMIPEIPKNP